jgi:hypothetical protein
MMPCLPVEMKSCLIDDVGVLDRNPGVARDDTTVLGLLMRRQKYDGK